jgi:hypothetical protein
VKGTRGRLSRKDRYTCVSWCSSTLHLASRLPPDLSPPLFIRSGLRVGCQFRQFHNPALDICYFSPVCASFSLKFICPICQICYFCSSTLRVILCSQILHIVIQKFRYVVLLKCAIGAFCHFNGEIYQIHK